MMLATLKKFNGLSDLCNAYDTLGSRNFVQMAVIISPPGGGGGTHFFPYT